MTLRLLLPAALVRVFTAPVVEALAPDDPPAPEWTKELKRLQGLTEIHRCTAGKRPAAVNSRPRRTANTRRP